ncbi:MAG: hypothetical protein H7175_10045, partial [Burkholderiales bacterium]|nr:hypothetical protein [Anaerolineae bacterium]
SMTTNEQSLSDFYYHISHKAGRNNGLFAAARKARNQHWSLAETIIYLTPLHTAQIGNLAHRKENIHQRRREALCTIASAFSRPALETLPDSSVQENPGLPNAVREALLQTQIANTQQSCAAARVLDVLRMVGWKAGKIFTASEALTVCKVFKIGRDSLLRALSAVGKWGKKLIPKSLMLSRVSAPNKTQNEAEPPQLTAGGRPKQRYEMPDNIYLQAAVGISETAPQESDPLQPDDLASPSAYRAAIERELLKRRPGQYPNRWLARRLGISKRTIQRYHKLLGVSIKPVFGYTQYTDSSAFRDLKSRNAELCGIWLQDQDGKRYPPIAALAAKLQKRGHILTFIRQQPNYYSLSPNPIENQLPSAASMPASERLQMHPETSAASSKSRKGNEKLAQMFWRCLRCGAFIPGQSKHTPSHCEACALGAPALHTAEAPVRELLSRLRSGIGGQQTLAPKIVSAVLTWRNLHDIVPPQEYAPETGAWLQDPSGKRYPPIRGLAMRLLKRFGSDNVRYFSHDESAAVFHDLGLWLAREGQYEGAMHFFRRAGLNAVDADAGQ